MALETLAPLDNFFQHGYVTNDFDRARAYFTGFGLRDWFEMREIEIQVMGEKTAKLSVGLAWYGVLQVEIIHPLGGDCDIYRDILPASGFGLKLHHHGFLIYDEAGYDGLRAAYPVEGAPVVIDGFSSGSGNRYFYADTRAQIGHYVEYIYATPSGRKFYDSLPQNKRP